MFVYAGIDEAGYGPLLGPLTVARAVIAIPKLDAAEGLAHPPELWQRLSRAVCRDIKASDRRGRIPVNDSKKLRTQARPLEYIEPGCLAFAHAAGLEADHVGAWLRAMAGTEASQLSNLKSQEGESQPASSFDIRPSSFDISPLPWYRGPTNGGAAWGPLPRSLTSGEVAVARSLLSGTMERIGVEVGGVSVAVVPEDRFNEEVATTQSKAAVAFRRVGTHLQAIWSRWGKHHPLTIVDRQGGRTGYRTLLMDLFPAADLTVIEEQPQASAYLLRQGDRAMTIRFEVEAETRHLPVALASMLAKYTRELVMERFNAHFTAAWPDLKPTAGYGSDAKRWLADAAPRLADLGLSESTLRRRA